MKRSVLTYKTRLLLTTGALFITCASMICMASPAARAQDDNGQLMNRLNELENQVQTLNRAVYRGDQKSVAAVGKGVSDADTQAAASADQRMSAIEEQQQKITGEIEKLSHDVQQLQDHLDKSQADTEQRLLALEHGGAATAAAATTAPVMANAPAATAAGEAGAAPEGSLGTTDGGSAGPAEALYEDAFADVKDAKYDDGEAKFKQFLSQYPGHPLTANAEYWLGEIYYVQGKFKDAARTFAQGYQTYPKSGKAEDSLYKLALSLNKLGKKDDACLSLRQMQKDFGGDTGPLHLKAQAEIKQLQCP